MSARWLIVDVLLALAVLVTVVSSVGVLVMRDPYQKLHYLGPAAAVAPFLVTAAVFLGEPQWQAGVKALASALLLTAMNGVVAHATARAARVREKGQWEPAPGERVPLVGTGREIVGEKREAS